MTGMCNWMQVPRSDTKNSTIIHYQLQSHVNKIMMKPYEGWQPAICMVQPLQS